jgi:L-rhamnose mutarotase
LEQTSILFKYARYISISEHLTHVAEDKKNDKLPDDILNITDSDEKNSQTNKDARIVVFNYS